MANSVTGSLQVPVSHEAKTGTNDFSEPTYAAAVTLQAIVEEGTRPHRLRDATTVTTRAHLTFLRPVSIGVEDRITLPSGLRAPVVDVDPAPVDPSTNAGYCLEVWLG